MIILKERKIAPTAVLPILAQTLTLLKEDYVDKEDIEKLIEENKEILEALGSDYDDKGIPYWMPHND